MICAGIDAGSRTIKAVLLDAERMVVLGEGVVDQGIEQKRLARLLLERIAEESGIGMDDIAYTVATGYGRGMLDFADKTITEITCHAAGVTYHLPETSVIIDIGGQDSKVIHLEADGTVYDFSMNDRCAAGTGRFLELVANRTEVPIERLGELASKSRSPAAISSMCVVFAETEIVGLMAEGVETSDIIAGVQFSIAERIAAMSGPVNGGGVTFTGGVAMIPGMRETLEDAVGAEVRVCSSPQKTGAMGAALLAARRVRNINKIGGRN
ncbi:2-hydroxyglutaryl-CoA dehydratase component A [Anaerohalosphaera lusitana]|uniref:2-hydroxyglutaryl-CoA dehydratase component A n=1 Tax=Anaerohalosphaera lusitana TaxID=1936003 RepID=A0A1U9NJW3_9BACT|nr:acyl-CoA dehydratase activase [Anaerohalosphaera lusitana]AQT68212.1 2-hydroxyglutaryl-CoA dehydratase component A [Anaerohalosphaera lusitana]